MGHYLALDLGASGGRAILGSITDRKLVLEELHRFANEPVEIPEGLYWDTFRLWHEVLAGAAKAGHGRKLSIDGMGVDTWGVDFGLFASDGSLIGNPRHYRDPHNTGMVEALCEALPREEIFAHTGIQFMDLNSLAQLFAMKRDDSPALGLAAKLLFMPDIFNYWLTGRQCAERTIASTSQFYDPRRRAWAVDLLTKLGLPTGLLPEIVDPGTKLGQLRPPVADATGLAESTPVFATGCHDTASAVAAVPARGDCWCYISSGTWSLMGAEIDEPVINDQALAANLTNEVGAGGTVRLLKNIAGMWLLQECRRAWAVDGDTYDYARLVEMAEQAHPFAAIISPDSFPEPGHMPERIAEYCRRTGQQAVSEPGAVSRAILESLALRYRQVLEHLEGLLNKRMTTIHIVGGGSQNRVLNQLAADCTGRTVVAGPTEATAIGNILLQAIGSGLISNLASGRELVRESFPVDVYEPRTSEGWDAAYERFLRLPA